MRSVSAPTARLQATRISAGSVPVRSCWCHRQNGKHKTRRGGLLIWTAHQWLGDNGFFRGPTAMLYEGLTYYCAQPNIAANGGSPDGWPDSLPLSHPGKNR